MRLCDNKNDQQLKLITIYLTPDEAIQLASYCQHLAKNPENHHTHFNDNEYIREIILAVYTSHNIYQFDKRSRELLGDDWKRSRAGRTSVS